MLESMKTSNSSFAFLLTACGLFISCHSQPPVENQTAAAPTFTASMQNLKELMIQLLPIVVDVAQFNAPENRQRVDSDVQKLVEVSRQVVHSPVTEKLDPGLRMISTAFSEDLRRAQESLTQGKRDFARYNLLNVTAYCIECHTRTAVGPSFKSPSLEQAILRLKPMERGEFLLATREFDRALAEFTSAIKDMTSHAGSQFDLERAVRQALSITVKFQRDPQKALQVVDLIVNSQNTPYYLRQNARAWQVALNDWKKEKIGAGTKSSDVIKHAEGLVRAGRVSQTGTVERGGDIYYLRALSELNAVLMGRLQAEELGHSLYLTGVCYEALRDSTIWALHEDYYESCIRQVPHGKWSEKCYTHLEESIYLGYSGTSGLSLPLDVKVKLDDLKKLALPDLPAGLGQ